MDGTIHFEISPITIHTNYENKNHRSAALLYNLSFLFIPYKKNHKLNECQWRRFSATAGRPAAARPSSRGLCARDGFEPVPSNMRLWQCGSGRLWPSTRAISDMGFALAVTGFCYDNLCFPFPADSAIIVQKAFEVTEILLKAPRLFDVKLIHLSAPPSCLVLAVLILGTPLLAQA